MRWLQALAVYAAALFPIAAADIIIGQTTCLTGLGSRSVRHVPTVTSSQTVFLTIISTKTLHLRTTVTPVTTITVDSLQIDTTTLAQNTDTITSTSVTTTTSTVVIDVLQASTVTVVETVVVAPTVTISTAANFTPFASEAAVIAAGGGTSNSKRRRSAPHPDVHNLKRKLAVRGGGAKTNLVASQFPQSVTCIVFIDDIQSQTTTISASTTQTHTAPLVVLTSTSIATITSTIVPSDASTTVTTTSTANSITVSIIIQSTTVTSTSTSTTFSGSAATYYPQCQSNNLIEYVGGQQLFPLISNYPTTANTTDAAACCQLCANTNGCAGFSGPTPGYTDCIVFGDGGTCDASQSDWTVYFANGETSDFDVVGNGNCGQGTFGGTYQ